jgi:hypothetical protein
MFTVLMVRRVFLGEGGKASGLVGHFTGGSLGQ